MEEGENKEDGYHDIFKSTYGSKGAITRLERRGLKNCASDFRACFSAYRPYFASLESYLLLSSEKGGQRKTRGEEGQLFMWFWTQEVLWETFPSCWEEAYRLFFQQYPHLRDIDQWYHFVYRPSRGRSAERHSLLWGTDLFHYGWNIVGRALQNQLYFGGEEEEGYIMQKKRKRRGRRGRYDLFRLTRIPTDDQVKQLSRVCDLLWHRCFHGRVAETDLLRWQSMDLAILEAELTSWIIEAIVRAGGSRESFDSDRINEEEEGTAVRAFRRGYHPFQTEMEWEIDCPRTLVQTVHARFWSHPSTHLDRSRAEQDILLPFWSMQKKKKEKRKKKRERSEEQEGGERRRPQEKKSILDLPPIFWEKTQAVLLPTMVDRDPPVEIPFFMPYWGIDHLSRGPVLYFDETTEAWSPERPCSISAEGRSFSCILDVFYFLFSRKYGISVEFPVRSFDNQILLPLLLRHHCRRRNSYGSPSSRFPFPSALSLSVLSHASPTIGEEEDEQKRDPLLPLWLVPWIRYFHTDSVISTSMKRMLVRRWERICDLFRSHRSRITTATTRTAPSSFSSPSSPLDWILLLKIRFPRTYDNCKRIGFDVSAHPLFHSEAERKEVFADLVRRGIPDVWCIYPFLLRFLLVSFLFASFEEKKNTER